MSVSKLNVFYIYVIFHIFYVVYQRTIKCVNYLEKLLYNFTSQLIAIGVTILKVFWCVLIRQ